MQRSMISAGLSAVSLRDLSLVQAVHRLGGFTAAAREMHMSTSGLSHQIQKVEQALGVTLFERGGRHVLPTAAGRRLLARIDQVLAVAEDLERGARGGEAAFGGLLRLGVLGTLGPYLLPHLVEPFPQRFPETRLSLSEGKPRGLLRRLREGELDAVLVQATPVPAGITRQALFFEPFDVLLHRSHALSGRERVHLDELGDNAILMAETHGSQGETEVDERVQDVSLESLAALVALRGGYTLVPRLAHQRLASIDEIRLARVVGDHPGRHIALYWRQASPWCDDLLEFGKLLHRIATSLPAVETEPSP